MAENERAGECMSGETGELGSGRESGREGGTWEE